MRVPGSPAQRATLLFASVAAAHVATIALARAISRSTTEGVPLWAAAGVTVAVLLLAPRRLWPLVLLSTFATNVVSNLVLDIGAATSTISAFANTVEPLIGALVVLRLLGTAPRLDDKRHLLVFLGGAGVAGPLVGAVIGSAGIHSYTAGSPPFVDVAERWFIGDSLGVLVVGSLLLGWAQPAVLPRSVVRGPAEALAVAAGVVGLTYFAFWGSSPVLAYATLPPLAWASIRFGVRGATLGGLAVAVIADWATIRGHGLFVALSGVGEHVALLQLQVFLAVLLIAALVLAGQVSALGHAEEALLASEEKHRFSTMLESSPEPILVLRGDSTVAYLNEGLLSLTGRTRDELIGKPFVDLLNPARRPRVLDILSSVLAQPVGSRSTFEMEGLGEVLDRSLETAITPLDTLDGRLLVATIRDVTERNRAEAALRSALDAAEAATTAKTQFLATMSHEIRTPMSAVTSLIELLDHTALDEEQQALLATMRSSSAALLRIIDDTLDFSKIEAGMLQFESVPLAVDVEISAIASLMEPAAATKGISLVCKVEPERPPAVVGDPVRIRQILLNLVGNAIKFTKHGGVELVARFDAEPVDGVVDVAFTVRDTGIGMDADRQADLFRPFTQAEHSTTRLYGGTGLGLSIVSRLIELMDGSVDVTSAPGEGSTFVVKLPLAVAPEGAQPAPRPRSTSSTLAVDHGRIGGHLVLIAEDNTVNRDVLRRQLALIGCACDAVADGQAALDRLAAGGISLLLTDCHMPVLDGFQLTRTIRGDEERSGAAWRLPVVAITANAMDGEGDRCVAAGMDAYLTKPVDVGRLAGLLADLLPSEPVRGPAPIDLGILREIVGDDEAAVVDILGTCAESIVVQADELSVGFAAGDGPRMAAAAHRISGAGASVGAARLASFARAVELGAASGNPDVLGSSIDWLRVEVQTVVDEVSRLAALSG